LSKSHGTRADTAHWPIYTDVILCRAPRRTDGRQITFYYTVGNWGVQFAALGGHVKNRQINPKNQNNTVTKTG
jgi:alanine dehydrogenase